MALIVCAALALAGCATFHPLPLPRTAGAASLSDVSLSGRSMPVNGLDAARPRDGGALDAQTVAALAVANNPHLKVLRDAVDVADAQAFAAGLLPDPQLAWSRDFVTSGPGVSNPFGLGLSWDIGSLLTRGTRTGAADW
ncbi:MAG TPA: TolC family protein, partial [Nevskiaceae bacterium]